MPRVTQASRTSPAVSRSTPSRPATPAAATTPTWQTTGARPAAKKALLDVIVPSLHNPPTKALGAAKLADTIAGVKVKSATEHEYLNLTSGRSLANRGVEVSFGTLSRPQFDALKAEFGARSQVTFDAKREYGVIDFLPPAMQGLVGKDLDTGAEAKVKLPKKMADEMRVEGELTIGSTPNCHGTAWEMMRAYQGTANTHVQLGYGDFNTATTHYEAFKSLGVTAPGAKLDLSALQPGDVVTMSGWDGEAKTENSYELLHSAVYVGGGLFFEKPDTEHDVYGESPYRLVTLDQVTAALSAAKGDANFSLHPRRAKEPLAPLSQAFASADAAALEAHLGKKGQTLGKPLVSEFVMSMAGTIRGVVFNTVLTQQVSVGADGRGVLK